MRLYFISWILGCIGTVNQVKTNFSPIYKKPLYFIAKNSVQILLNLFWRMEVKGLEYIPLKGGVIIAPNHRSLIDPPLVGSALHREVHFLAKEELFSFKPFGWLISRLNAHPLKRSGDIGAFKMARRLLDMGEAVIIFPEGRRSKTENLGKGKPGVGLLAEVTKVPIVPAYIQNSGYFSHLKKLRIEFSKPIYPRNSADYQAIADHVMQEIEILKNSVEN